MILTEWCVDMVNTSDDMNGVHFSEETKDGLSLKWNKITCHKNVLGENVNVQILVQFC